MKILLTFLAIIFVSLNAFALEIVSDVFESNGYIPDRYACDAQDFSPFLSFRDVPEGTKSLVLICDDPDAPFKVWVHWVLFNIPKEVTELKENITAEEMKSLGIIAGVNDFGKLEYKGPCPPAGKPHRYFFKLYALDTQLPLEAGAAKKEIVKAMEGHIIAEAKVVGLYQRQTSERSSDDKN